MKYTSTRNNGVNIEAKEAIANGISKEGGLYIPCELPKLSDEEIKSFCKLTYAERAFEIFKLFLTDFTDDEIKYAVNNAYSDNFSVQNVTELSRLTETDAYLLELWHGPTCAFKDMALQVLPYLLTTSAKTINGGKKSAILVATSGDTGKAALEGFKDVENTKIIVFYPEDGVSDMQKRQMMTQEGENVAVYSVRGNFDDCQNGVKDIFTNDEVIDKLSNMGYKFSSANSINWGRLLPQVVYYISAYADLVNENEINFGDKVNVVVPTGNFGNILAAYFAKEMGVPINKLICASNSNNVLTDFIKTGEYNRNREFITTVSPSMDILISSNLERLLYLLSGKNDKIINEWFNALKNEGKYKVNGDVLEKLQSLFYGGFCSEDETKAAIKNVFDEYSYLMDTHTAVAYKVYENYRNDTNDNRKTIIASTANPYKFVDAVYGSLSSENDSKNEFETAEKLEKYTKTKMPSKLLETKTKELRFKDVINKDQMVDVVLKFFGEN